MGLEVGVAVRWCVKVFFSILPQNALKRDCNGKCIERIEGHYLEVVVLLYNPVRSLSKVLVRLGKRDNQISKIPPHILFPCVHTEAVFDNSIIQTVKNILTL